ncbi:hypothetical protein GCM10010149_89240 [Nonomuraea roseoviolacea subsp. roseoviolacea]|uniref:phage baseplate assembly protein V n=1 Tax=Nonomuraea roseoviolacea TaxID=103837 RepID=UPI0031E3D7D2
MREHNGLYQAIVESANDPKKQRRITARVPDVLGQTVSEWARPASIVDSPLPPGSMVWIHFPNGDVRYPVYHVPNDPKHGRVIPGKSALSVDGPGAGGVTLDGDVHAKKSGGGYVNMYAVDFIKTSSAAEKKDLAPLDFDPVEAVQNAPVFSYRYKANDHVAVGPLREDLPGIVHVGDSHVSEGSLIGILWAAVSDLSTELRELQSEVANLRDELRTINEN